MASAIAASRAKSDAAEFGIPDTAKILAPGVFGVVDISTTPETHEELVALTVAIVPVMVPKPLAPDTDAKTMLRTVRYN